MHRRDDHNHFAAALSTLKKYKKHISDGIAKLINDADPISIKEEEYQANLYHSNSHASKKKRNQDLALAIRLYNKEQQDILSMINRCKTERLKQAELDEKNYLRRQEEKERFYRHEKYVKLNHEKIFSNENEKTDDFIEKLQIKASECLDKIKKHIDQLQDTIIKLQQDIQQQKEIFIQRIRHEIRETLTRMYKVNGDYLQISSRTEKITIHLESLTNAISTTIENQFNKNLPFEHKKLQAAISQTFANIIYNTAAKNNTPIHVEQIANNFSNEVMNKTSEIYETASILNQIQLHRKQYLEDNLQIANEIIKEIDSIKVDSTIKDTSFDELMRLTASLDEISKQIDSLKIDPQIDNRTNSALEAFHKQTVATQEATVTPTPQEPAPATITDIDTQRPKPRI